jgi:hypothetical protein
MSPAGKHAVERIAWDWMVLFDNVTVTWKVTVTYCYALICRTGRPSMYPR